MSKLDQLHPVLRRKVRAILNDLLGHGYKAIVASAWRSSEDQLALYRAGRSKVTFSFHNATYPQGSGKWEAPCALAADICDARLGWNASAEFKRLLKRSAVAHELVSGADWKSFGPDGDWAHVQLLPNSDLKRVKAGWLPAEEA